MSSRPRPGGPRRVPKYAERAQCRATVKHSKEQCKKPAIPGLPYCSTHASAVVKHIDTALAKPTDPCLERFFEAVELGVTIPIAAAYARIPYTTVIGWLKKGMAGDPQYEPFFMEVLHRSSLPIIEAVKVVRENNDKWAMKWLEFRYPYLQGADNEDNNEE